MIVCVPSALTQVEQADERASLSRGNKGAESMEVALEMADLLAQLK